MKIQRISSVETWTACHCSANGTPKDTLLETVKARVSLLRGKIPSIVLEVIDVYVFKRA